MPAGPNDATFTVGPEVNEEAFRAFGIEMEKRFQQVTEKIVSQVGIEFSKFAKQAGQSFDLVGPKVRKAAKEVAEMGDQGSHAFEGINRQVEQLLAVITRLGRSISENVSALTTVREANRRASVETTARSQDVARAQIEDVRAASRAHSVETQRITTEERSAALERIQVAKNEGRQAAIVAQAASKRRVLITQAALQSIGRLEKGLGATIAGAARTATSAFGRAFDAINARRGGGIAGAVAKQNTELNSELRRTNSIVETNTREINNSFTKGTSSSLNERESIMRRSFIEQEQIIRRSTVRQEAAFDRLRKVSSTGVAGAVTGRGIGIGIGGLVAGAGIGAFLKQGFDQAVNLNEQLNKTRVVFGDAAQSVIDFSKDAVNSLGATRAEALTASATFGNLFRALGIGERPAAKMSNSLVQLAADLSSFNNVPIDDAFEAIRSGLVGENEPLRKFGVNISDVTLKAKALQLGLSDGKGVLNANTKAQAAYALILEQTTLAQGDFARTADVGANAQRRAGKAALELSAALASKLMPAANVLFRVLITGFSGLTKLLLDQTSPVLKVIKDGLFGAAAGLAAIIAAKGAVQVFQLLTQAMKLTLTPMGALLVGAALLGAGLSILLRRSAPLRAAFDALGDRLGDVAKKALAILVPALQFVGRVIDQTVIPFIEKLTIFLAEHVVFAFDAVSKFIANVAVPAIVRASQFVARNAVAGWRILVRFFEERVMPVLRTIAQFIQESVVPRVVQLAKVVKEDLVDALHILVNFLTGSVYPAIFGIGLAFGPAGVAIAAVASAVIFFWDTVRLILEPAIRGFETLGEAISKAFTLGDFSGIGSGLAAAGQGIAKVAGTIGGLIVDVLAAAGRSIVATLKRVFALPNLIAAGKGFLDFVEFVGRTLGRIVTDPRFVTAVAAIGAGLATGAGLIVFRFLKGFGEAFFKNLPALVRLLVNGLTLAFTQAFKFVVGNPALAAVIISGILLIFEARSLIQGISAAGQKAGGGFFKGFVKSVKSSVGGGTSQLAGFFGFTGGTADSRLIKTFQATNKEIEKEVLATQGRLRSLGSTTVVVPHSLDAAKEEINKLSIGLSEARLKGLLLRDSLNLVGIGTKEAFKGLGKAVSGSVTGVVRGLADALSATSVYNGPATSGARAFSRAFSAGVEGSKTRIASGFSTIFEGIRQVAVDKGTSVGKLVGTALAKGAVGAVLAVGGFQAGKAEGGAGGSGILSALLGGVTAGAVVGGGPFGIAVGGATAGLALLGAEMGRAEKKAKEFRDEVNKLSEAFRGPLVDAIETGQIKLSDFGATKIDLSTVLGLGDNFQATIQAIAAKLKPDQIQTLVDALGTGAITKITGILRNANGDLDKFNKDFSKALLTNASTTQAFLSKVGGDTGLAAQVADALAKIAAPGGSKDIVDALTGSNANQFSPAVATALLLNQKFFQSILDTNSAIVTEAKVVVDATKEVTAYAEATAKIPGKAGLFTTTLSDGVVAVNNAIQTSQDLVAGATGRLDALQKKSIETFEKLVTAGVPIDEAIARLAEVHLPPVPQSEVDAFTSHLDDIAASAQSINDQLGLIPDNFAAAINAANGVTPNVSVDQAVLASGSIASQISDAFLKGPNSVTGNAQLADATRAAGETIGKVLADGVATGAVVDTESARAFVAPVQTAMVEALGVRPADDPAAAAIFDESVAQIAKIFTDGLSGIQPIIDNEKLLADIQAFMTTHPLVLAIDAAKSVAFLNALNADQGFLREGDLRRFGGAATFAGGSSPAQNTPAPPRPPDVTNVTIVESASPRATARATIAELRADRLLRHGII